MLDPAGRPDVNERRQVVSGNPNYRLIAADIPALQCERIASWPAGAEER